MVTSIPLVFAGQRRLLVQFLIAIGAVTCLALFHLVIDGSSSYYRIAPTFDDATAAAVVAAATSSSRATAAGEGTTARRFFL